MQVSIRTVVETLAGRGGELEIETVPGGASDSKRAQRLLGEIAAVQSRNATAVGLIRAIALIWLEIEKLTLAQLQRAWLQAEHGIAFPQVHDVGFAAPYSEPAARVEDFLQQDDDGTFPWVDQDYPEILILAKVPARYVFPVGVTATMKRGR